MSNKKEENLARYLTNSIIDRYKGKDKERVYEEKPSKQFFIGSINPVSENKIFSKISPSQVGVSGLVDSEDIEDTVVKISVRGNFYYRVFPTFEEQVEYVRKKRYQIEEVKNKDKPYNLRSVYKKTDPAELIVTKNLGEIVDREREIEENINEIDSVVTEVKKEAETDSEAYVLPESAPKITFDDLENEDEFENFINNIEGEPIDQDWSLNLRLKIKPFKGKYKITAFLENKVEQTEKRRYRPTDNTFFDTNITLELEGSDFEPYILDYLSDNYKFDGNMESEGINCSSKNPQPNFITSVHAPIYEQKRRKSNKRIKANIQALIDDPINELNEIEKEMDKHYSDLEKIFDKESSEMTKRGKAYFKKDIEDFKICLDRYKNGVEVLKKDNSACRAVSKAFELMNKTFKNASKGYDAWYLFQIVFIVSIIPDIASVHDENIDNFRDLVDLIYFPTGGGKTEAYLGVVVMQMFFDRLMGKKAGVSALTRFPLRLLSLQQLQRIADIFAEAEKIRRKHPKICKNDYSQFSTGYFVGNKNTPNKLTMDLIEDLKKGNEDKERYKIITKCPFCQDEDSVEIRINESDIRLEYICTNPNCDEEVLPIYISDYEIYRYLPTFIIGTIDKNASCSRQRYFRHIFGQVEKYCPDHGYFSGRYCLQSEYNGPGCTRDEKDFKNVDLYDPTPSLVIQDEIHLIRESLGSYTAHYESFFDEYMNRITNGEKELKIIGATATIQEYEHQMKHLYQRKAVQFPPPSTNRTKSFFSYKDEEDLSRFIVGIMPHNKTIIYSVLDILQHYYEEIKKIEKNPSLLLKEKLGFEDKKDVQESLNYYKLLLSYNLVKLEGDRITQSVNTMINPNLREKNIDEIDVRTMTGDVTFSDVRDVLNKIESGNVGDDINLITATSMISHGVDLDSLNFMVFRGMPRNTAEYIQAFSRVGRKFPGIVINVFNHTRERDRSHYKYFNKFHEYQSILVDPVPINRWAKFSINRTLPGIFCGMLLNYYGSKARDYGLRDMHMADLFSKAFSQRQIETKDMMEFIQSCYGTDTSEMGYNFKLFIDNKIEQYIGEILDNKDKERLEGFIPNILSDEPMLSLRDTDIAVEVKPTRESFDPMEKVGMKKTGEVE